MPRQNHKLLIISLKKFKHALKEIPKTHLILILKSTQYGDDYLCLTTYI